MNYHRKNTKKIIQTSSSRVYILKALVIIHLNTLASYMYITADHVILSTEQHHKNLSTRIYVYLKKQAHVGNSGCLSSVPIRWLASSAAPAVIFTKEDSDDL